MLNIRLAANKDAFKLRDADLSKKDIKRIACSNAKTRYPGETKATRGLYKHHFYKILRYYEYQSWIDEIGV